MSDSELTRLMASLERFVVEHKRQVAVEADRKARAAATRAGGAGTRAAEPGGGGIGTTAAPGSSAVAIASAGLGTERRMSGSSAASGGRGGAGGRSAVMV